MELADFLQTKYDWDLHAARSIWAFGPDKQGPNLLLQLLGDTILLNAVKHYIIKGFKLGVEKGPICQEPMRNVKFTILEAIIADDAMMDEVVHIMQRATHLALLEATPRRMEPIYLVQIQAPRNYLDVVNRLLVLRKGQVISTEEVPQRETPTSVIKAHLPVIESFGFNDALKEQKGFCQCVFDHWGIVPENPRQIAVNYMIQTERLVQRSVKFVIRQVRQ
ncbi:hypothetical protein H5410_035240 [Solanum commersonii]|uniref:Elongation factor EFG domain-containing protein n=1 Tax=Solanum commersonii TaxID=4109 RepID=A0A9J5Y380_SOLCO|nr:hypothetical protein H5410_035240 [Solanum commersonii]